MTLDKQQLNDLNRDGFLMSPWDRSIFSLILNPVSNAYTKDARPDHKHHRDLSDVSVLADDCLLTQNT